VGGRDGDLPWIPEAIGHEVRHEARALAVDGGKRGHEVGLGYDTVLHESARQAGQRTLGCGDRHGSWVKSLATFDNKHRTFTAGSSDCQRSSSPFVTEICRAGAVRTRAYSMHGLNAQACDAAHDAGPSPAGRRQVPGIDRRESLEDLTDPAREAQRLEAGTRRRVAANPHDVAAHRLEGRQR